MSEKIGRLGYLGLAVEAVAGTPESTPDVFIPFTDDSMRGHHEPLGDISARTSRVMDAGSVVGKKWGEGSVEMYLDATNVGYLLKLALGQEARTAVNGSVSDHLFIPTVSGNAATTATLWDSKGVDTEQYSYATIDTLEMEVSNDGIATVKAGFMAKDPSSVSAPALSTTSGYLFTWKDMTIKFGSTVNAALSASATKITNFMVNIANNVEMNYKSGSNSPDTITYGALEVTGSYTLFFESVTDRDAYYGLTKRSIVVDLVGGGLPGATTERLRFVIKKPRIEDIEIETGLDDLFAIKCNFRAELDQTQAGYFEATLRNGKTSDYS